MSTTLLRVIIAGVLAFHGIGHAMGVISALKLINVDRSEGSVFRNWSSDSGLLTDLLGDPASRVVCTILYLVALIGFLGAALGLMGWGVPHDWWRTLAIVSAVISLVALVLYWNALMLLSPPKVGALAINIATLVCLIWSKWPSEADLGF
jgi:hypothetical protein